MKTVWNGEIGEAQDFLSGEDIECDLHFLPYDIISTKAHARVLCDLELITDDEADRIVTELNKLNDKYLSGELTSLDEAEDVHSFVELWLTKKLGDTGKKIHLLRSRNDLVCMDTCLFTVDNASEISTMVARVQFEIYKRKEDLGLTGVKIPGYTHLQPAMPYTALGYLGAFDASLSDDLVLLDTFVEKIGTKMPLGSGAGFGFEVDVPKINYTLHLESFFHFSPEKNHLYSVLSRSKVERSYLYALFEVANSIEKFANTLIFLYHKGAVELPSWATTGSSVMPQKQNPDVLEVLRGRSKRVKACFDLSTRLDSNLGVGYFRDLQEGKPALIRATKMTNEMLKIVKKLIPNLQFNEIEEEGIDATEEAIKLVFAEGIPWREAYKQVSNKILKNKKR